MTGAVSNAEAQHLRVLGLCIAGLADRRRSPDAWKRSATDTAGGQWRWRTRAGLNVFVALRY